MQRRKSISSRRNNMYNGMEWLGKREEVQCRWILWKDSDPLEEVGLKGIKDLKWQERV